MKFLERIGAFFTAGKARACEWPKRPERQPPRCDLQRRKQEQQARVDTILDKISRSGYDSLSKEEKDFLFRASGRH